jgi:cytochrome P450
MDPPEHTAYRSAIEPYFSARRVEAFEPLCQSIALQLVQDLGRADTVELMAAWALPFAVQVQCAFLGWPAALHAPLAQWTHQNHQATLAQDRGALTALALQFEAMVADVLQQRRDNAVPPGYDVTASLLHESVQGRPLSVAEIASILRNWTVGEIGTIAAAVGILAGWLAEHPDTQALLRSNVSLQPEAIDEILRLQGPLATNRRTTTCPVVLGGRRIEEGERVTVHWAVANRDARVFDAPETFRLGRNPADNLLYGAGIHVCPGAPLARMELRVALRALLDATENWACVPDQPFTVAQYPASGYAAVPLRLRWA